MGLPTLSEMFGFKSNLISNVELPEIFPMNISQVVFTDTDTLNIYLKILTDVVSRVHGLSEEAESVLWDNCLASESSNGLVSMLAKAMTEKQDLFLVYERPLKLLRKAKSEEIAKIREDYRTQGKSSVGVFISFKHYSRTDMVKLYSSLEYCTIAALNKSMNLSKAMQLKISDLRGSVSLADADAAKSQAQSIATSLGKGLDVLMDAKDSIVTSAPDLTSVKEAMVFLNQKRSFYLGLPASYITGEAPKGLGDTGEGDAKAVERGLKIYYFSIFKPVIEALFDGLSTTFKSQDFRQISSALEALKTFELVSDELLSQDNKRIIVNKLLDLDEDEMGDEPEAAPAPPVALQKPPVKQVPV